VGSQPGGSEHTPVVDWVAVYTMLAGSVLLGLSLPLTSWWLGIAGGILFVVGAGIGVAYGIMDHTEDYETFPKPETAADASAEPHRKRIISA
jgi:hypothetical protein